MKVALDKRYAVIAILVIAILGAVAYQFMQPEKENPAVTLCGQQFMQTQNVSGEVACLTEAAVAQLDPTICVQVWELSTWMKSDCMKAVIAAAPEDPSVYEKLRSPNVRAHFQYYKYDYYIFGNYESRKDVDEGIDEYFLDTVRGRTNLSLNISEKHMFICETIENLEKRCKCYRAIASATGNTSICEIIPLLVEKDSCYWSIISDRPDPAICEKIVDTLLRTDCYSTLASMIKDESLCDKIEIPERKEICHKEFAQIQAGANP